MIFVIRITEPKLELRGFQVLTLSDWTLPTGDVSGDVFLAFDVALRKLQSDAEATRIGVPGQRENELTGLNTAREAALRAVPERMAVGARLYSAFFHLRERRLWTDFPNWLHLAVESRNGGLVSLARPTGTPPGWLSLSLEADDSHLHLAPFRELRNLSPSRIDLAHPRSFRFSPLLEEAELSGRAPFRAEIAIQDQALSETIP